MWQFVHRNRQRVVIVGGNFAGLSAASKLSRRFDVTVIDPLQNFEWTPNIHEILSGVKSENGLLLSRSKILQRLGHQFLQDSVSNISIEDNLVHTQAGIQLPYDYCVVATGGERQTYGAAGAEENSFPFLAVHHIRAIKKRLSTLLDRQDKVNVAIVGGGVSGVEALGELLRHDPFHARLNLTLVEAGARILPSLPHQLDTDIRQYFKKYNVALSLGAAVTSLSTDEVELSNGSSVAADLTIWAAGVKPPELLVRSGLLKQGDNWAPTKQTLQSQYADNVFVIGDVGELPKPIRKQAYFAIEMGESAARNIQLLARSRPLKCFKPVNKPMLIAFGAIDTYLVVGNTVVAGKVLAAAKEGIFQLSMFRLGLPLGFIDTQFNTSLRFFTSVKRIFLPELLSLQKIKSLKGVRVLTSNP